MIATIRRQLWLIGGTHESSRLAAALAVAQIPVVVTVTTESAQSLYPPAPDLRVVVTRFRAEELASFLQAQRIAAILDASHPFAAEISQLAIAMAAQLQIPYLRFERPVLARASETETQVESFEHLLAGDLLEDQRVLLTVGYQPLPLFALWQQRATLFARILPSALALETALAAGFSSGRLLAMRPPIPLELERALWQHWQISVVVTKASGQPGGEAIKRQLAQGLGVTLITIARPLVAYPQQTSDLATALAFCEQVLAMGA